MNESPPAASRSIVFAIDVEPDSRFCSQDDKWSGVALALRELRALRAQFEETTQAPVHFNWFLRFDPQIQQTWGRGDWVTEACPGLIPWLHQHADLSGIHTHFWRWEKRRQIWFSDFSDSAWQAHCVESSIEGYRSAFGVAPTASRNGDRWLSDDTVRILRASGIRHDLTVEPGAPSRPNLDDPYATSWLPDFRAAPRIPYRPSDEAFLIPESPSGSTDAHPKALWIVPVTTTECEYWQPQRRFPFLIRGSQTLNLVLSPRVVWKHLSWELDRQAAEPLVFVLRTGDLTQRRYLSALRFVTARLARHPGLRTARFTRLDQAVDSFVRLSLAKESGK